MRTRVLAVAAAFAVLPLTACGSAASTAHAVAASSHPAPSPALIAAVLGCQLAGPSVDPQDAYDTTAYDALSAAGNRASPCYAGTATADSVITFASQAEEDDWLHQNDLANSGQFANGYVGLVAGPLWVVPDGAGTAGLKDLARALAGIGGREVTAF